MLVANISTSQPKEDHKEDSNKDNDDTIKDIKSSFYVPIINASMNVVG